MEGVSMNPLSVNVRRTPPGVGCRRAPVLGGLACRWFVAMLSIGLASCVVTAPVLSRPAACVEPIEVVDQVDMGVAVLVGRDERDLRLAPAAGLVEGMVLSLGRPAPVCASWLRARARAIRGGAAGHVE